MPTGPTAPAGYDWVSFTTDYGLRDGYVAACAGVIARMAPRARVIDVTHEVPACDVFRGGAVLAQTVRYLPPAVHLAVVDPGVGTARRGVAIVAGGSVLVGPDNGLLTPAAAAIGPVTAAYQLAEPRFWLPAVTSTFHGRDVFAPVTAHLVNGLPPEQLGPPVDPLDLVRLPPSRAAVRPGELVAEVRLVDRFGNIQLAAPAADLTTAGFATGARVRVTVPGGRAVPATVGSTFADVPAGELVVMVDSDDHVAMAVNTGSAAAHLAVEPGAEVTLTPACPPSPAPA